MTDKKRKLGIIAGGGSIPKMLIEECIAQKTEFVVMAIEGNAEKDLLKGVDAPCKWIRIGQAGSGFKFFRDEKVDAIGNTENQ